MKRNLIYYTLWMVVVFFATRVYGQNNPPANIISVSSVQAAKTLSGWDVLSNLYQISLNDVTATSKSASFKSTIFGFLKNYNAKVNNSDEYRRLAWARYTQPYLNFDYKNNFDPSNLSFGITFSFINANDATRSPLLNQDNKSLDQKQHEIQTLVHPIIATLRQRYPNDYMTIEAHLAKFEKSMDKADLTPDLKAILPDDAIKKIEAMNDTFDKLNRRIANRWNATFTPEISYAFNRSGVQGASFVFNGIKGFTLFSKRTTQLTLKSGYVLGGDTVIKAIDINKHQVENQVGLNQVIANKMIKGSDGKSNLSPCVELGINYGYNYLTSGYTTGQKRDEPSLGAKFGVLVGTNSWLVLPVTYNYATKKTYASVSVKLNLGDPPFKSSAK